MIWRSNSVYRSCAYFFTLLQFHTIKFTLPLFIAGHQDELVPSVLFQTSQEKKGVSLRRPILPFAGFLISKSLLNVWITVAIATVAGIVGSLIDYYIGLKGVQSLAKHKILGRAIFSQTQLEIAASWFNKHGAIMVFLGRLIPGFRTLISFPAGAVRMKLPKFIAFTTAGCIIWNVILIYVGWYLGKNWAEVAGISRYLILITAVVFIFVVSYILVRRKRVRAESTKHW